MKWIVRGIVIGAGWALAGSAMAADITLFENDNFDGRRFTANGSISDFGNTGFNDRASSVVVRNGTWQLCSEAYFRGRCVTLGEGSYASLTAMGLNDRVSSARDLSWDGGGNGGWGGGGGGGAGGGGRAVLYDGMSFAGGSFAVNGPLANLDRTGFNDRAQSLIVFDGRWELCTDAGFAGRCIVYGPGRYGTLGSLTNQVSSIRPAPAAGGGAGAWGGGDGGWGGGNRVVLYESPNLSGRSFLVRSDFMANLDGTGFNDRASSLRVEGGYWLFCSDAGFRGTCRTFGPGDYPTLPPGLNNQISSGRRISESYPYSQNPAWGEQSGGGPAPNSPGYYNKD
jgi:Beta/Gamma crystallin